MFKSSPLGRPDDLLVECVARAAVACVPFVGKGDGNAADFAAVNAMKVVLSGPLSPACRVQIGEGERDEAPMLYSGESFGEVDDGELIEIAVDPLECTNACKNGLPDSFSVICANWRGNVISAPDVYMDKLATARPVPAGVLDISDSPQVNIDRLCVHLNKSPADLVVYVLDRDRNAALIEALGGCGVQLRLLQDGDVFAVLRTHSLFGEEGDVYMGVGGAPEGVLAAGFVQIAGGFFQGKFVGYGDSQLAKISAKGLDTARVYDAAGLVGQNPFFCLSFVTDGFKSAPTPSANKEGSVSYSVNVFKAGSLVSDFPLKGSAAGTFMTIVV